MSDIEVFELDDDFDPLEDMGLTPEEEIEEHDYLTPIPDADRSIVPEPEQLTDEEKLAKLLVGIPGQKHRILRAITLCESPRTIAEVAEELDAEHPQSGSVYDAARIVQLLVTAGGVACLDESEENADEPNDEGTLSVSVPEPSHYLATDAGLAFAAERMGLAPVEDLLFQEPQYLPIYKRILEMTAADGGCTKLDLNKAVDADDLCQEPRRFAEYFLFRLEDVAAVRWDGAWVATDLGAAVLNSSVFNA